MSLSRLRVSLATIGLIAALCSLHTQASTAEKDRNARPQSTLANDLYTPFLINNVFNYYGNNGDGSYNKFSTNNEGFEFFKGSGQCIFFEDGVIWGGYHKGRAVPKVGGSVYRHGLQAGPLLTIGTDTTDPVAADPAAATYRIYRVRPDVNAHVPFSSVEGMLNAEEVPLTGRYQSLTALDLYNQYIADWMEWPAADGAPFKDVDGNGLYDPTIDVPGQPDADQTLWYVANDMSSARTQNLAGCPPIGIEMHRTIWGYRRNGALGNTIFMSTVLINKSGAPVDSMYLVQWADPDLGDAGDDFVGCDTTRDLGYVYNAYASDGTFGTAVPAAGFVLLQGPMVPGAPSDTALFLGSRRPGFRNLRMSSFTLFSAGQAAYFDPAQGPNGDLQWYRMMKGTTAYGGVPIIDPNTAAPTMFAVAGDPVKATDGTAGWVDGQAGLSATDRRFAMVTGPFTFAKGDTQQVVVAGLASRGGDRLSNITLLRQDAGSVRTAYTNFTGGQPMPPMSYAVTTDSTQAAIAFRVDGPGIPITAVSVEIKTYTGQLVTTLPLADDGFHNDAAAGDGIWGGIAHLPARSAALKAGAVLTYAGGVSVTWGSVFLNITTAQLSVATFDVASDNINSDGMPNPGENVRYVFTLRNDSPVDLRGVLASAAPAAENGQFHIGALNSHAVYQQPYHAGDPASYFFFDVPAAYADSTIRVALVITDDSANVWRDTLVFPVRPLPGKLYTTPLQHTAGIASVEFSIQIVDPTHVKDHLYVIHGVDGATVVGGYTLKDSTTGTVLLVDHAPPDALGHTSPVVDGFKVLRGTIGATPGMKRWEIPQGTRRFSPVGGYAGVGLEGFSSAGDPEAFDRTNGTIGFATNFAFGGIGTTLTGADGHSVLLKLAAVDNVALWDPKSTPPDTNFSRGYRYLRAASSPAAVPSFAPWIINTSAGYPYQDYSYSVPFSAWDVDVNPPVRLAVGHFENNATAGLVDGRYWPGLTTVDNSAAREIAFIFRAPYTDAPDPALAVNMSNNHTTPLMWVMTCSRRADVAWTGSDQFLLVANHFPSSQDAWVFNPSVVTDVQRADLPSSFALLQNYPNPFNPSTTIRYALPAQGMVTVTVYDLLGRAVRHLVGEVQAAGQHAVVWHGDSDAGITVASGVYFYRCTAVRSDRSGQFVQTMKMILLH